MGCVTSAEAREPSEPAQTAPPDAQRTQPGHGAVVRRSFFQCVLWGRACPEHTSVGIVHAACSVRTGARAFLLTSRQERARARVCTDGLVCVCVRVRVRMYTYICVHVYMHTFLYMYYVCHIGTLALPISFLSVARANVSSRI